MGLIEEQAEVGEDHPELLPAVAVFELPQQVSRQLILQRRRKTMSSTQKGTFRQMYIAVTVDILYVTVSSPVCVFFLKKCLFNSNQIVMTL